MNSKSLSTLTLEDWQGHLEGLRYPIVETELQELARRTWAPGSGKISEADVKLAIDLLYEDLESTEIASIELPTFQTSDARLNFVAYSRLPNGSVLIVSCSDWTDYTLEALLLKPSWPEVEQALEYAVERLAMAALEGGAEFADDKDEVTHAQRLEVLRAAWGSSQDI
jgi:hypothetical protein